MQIPLKINKYIEEKITYKKGEGVRGWAASEIRAGEERERNSSGAFVGIERPQGSFAVMPNGKVRPFAFERPLCSLQGRGG